jgi:hypothetical protein
MKITNEYLEREINREINRQKRGLGVKGIAQEHQRGIIAGMEAIRTLIQINREAPELITDLGVKKLMELEGEFASICKSTAQGERIFKALMMQGIIIKGTN